MRPAGALRGAREGRGARRAAGRRAGGAGRARVRGERPRPHASRILCPAWRPGAERGTRQGSSPPLLRGPSGMGAPGSRLQAQCSSHVCPPGPQEGHCAGASGSRPQGEGSFALGRTPAAEVMFASCRVSVFWLLSACWFQPPPPPAPKGSSEYLEQGQAQGHARPWKGGVTNLGRGAESRKGFPKV